MALSPNQLLTEFPFRDDPSIPFASRDELTAAMMSPKYAANEAYRQTVEARLAVSDRSALMLGEQARQLNVTLAPAVPLTREDDSNAGPLLGDNW